LHRHYHVNFPFAEGLIPKRLRAIDLRPENRAVTIQGGKMEQKLEDRVAVLEEFVFETLVELITVLAEELQVSEEAAESGHGLQDFEIRMLLLAALKHRPLKDIVNLPTRELVPLLMQDLDEDASA
jgi:hypothetical protein